MAVELATDDAPPLDDIDAVIPVIGIELVIKPDSDAQASPEKIADDLA